MSDTTAIEWTDHTFNPWWGCSRVSPACRNCYADTQASRYGHHVWRRKGPRRMLSDANWAKPLKWNREAEAKGTPAKVFCASMADVFEDHPDVTESRDRLWGLVEQTPWLRWQLLTKRPENITRMAPWSQWPRHVWLGTSVETQRFADQRIPVLRAAAGHGSVTFLSCEPLLGALNLHLIDYYDPDEINPVTGRKVCGGCSGVIGIAHEPTCGVEPGKWHGISWVIAGGESGHSARPMHPEWVRSVRNQCVDAGVPFLFKQWGEWAPRLDGTHRVAFSGEHYPNPGTCVMSGEELISRVGKKAAGRVLDGRTWDQYPVEVTA